MFFVVGNEYLQYQGMNWDCSVMFGLMFFVSLGVLKEFWDSCFEGSGWSWKDLVWDVVGVSIGYIVW